jgi:UDPglucose--hexose-1-phosphate uridylyltransferase
MELADKQAKHFSTDMCPFDKGNEFMTPNEVARIGEETWRCRVVPNLYHALSIDTEPAAFKESCFEKQSGFGAHEVIIETDEHALHMTNFEHRHFLDYLELIRMRIDNLQQDSRIKYFSLFKNSGLNAGATLEHAHSQLMAMPFIPPKIASDLSYYQEYKKQHGRDLFDDYIHEEKLHKKGILFENSSFIALCPYASRFAFEVMIVAKEPIASILACEDTHIYALAEVMELVFTKLRLSLGEDFAFNMVIKNGDLRDPKNPNRFHIEILPRLYKIAGFELESGVYINTMLPETVVEVLKEV